MFSKEILFFSAQARSTDRVAFDTVEVLFPLKGHTTLLSVFLDENFDDIHGGMNMIMKMYDKIDGFSPYRQSKQHANSDQEPS